MLWTHGRDQVTDGQSARSCDSSCSGRTPRGVAHQVTPRERERVTARRSAHSRDHFQLSRASQTSQDVTEKTKQHEENFQSRNAQRDQSYLIGGHRLRPRQ